MSKYISKNNIILSLILIVFGTMFALISLPNHYNFRTYALDLGMFNNAIYDFSNFKNNVFSLGVQGKDFNYFYDHFSPITILFAPFRFLGTSGLLIAQIIAVLLGGIGVYKFAQLKTKNQWIHYLAIIYFFVHWGVSNAIAYDFHTNVIASMLLPWVLVAFHQKRWKLFSLMVFLMLISKENIGLWLFFIFIALLVQNWKKIEAKERNILMFSAVFSGAYFYIITSFIMPGLGEGSKQLFRYSHIGSSYSEIVKNLLSNPIDSLKYLYENTSQTPNFNHTKTEFHLMTLFAGGIAIVLRPSYFLMLIPLYAQKFLSSQLGLWGIGGHYSIEFVPIMTFALVDLFKGIKYKKIYSSVFIIVILSTSISNYVKMTNRMNKWYTLKNINLFKENHYKTRYDKEKIFNKIKTIDKEKTLSVSNVLTPHLGYRDKIYLYPRISDADRIVLLRPLLYEDNSYPLNSNTFDKEIKKNISEGWSITYDDGQLLILDKP